MLELKRILVPYDFSDAAGEAARYACDLARGAGAKITVLHVLAPLRYEFAMAEPTPEHSRDVNQQRAVKAYQAMQSLLPGLAEQPSVTLEVTEGDPAEEIIAASDAGGYDAIVMSTRGAGTFRRWFIIGSVTSKVLDGSERPVITSVRFEKHPSPLEIRRVLCAIDLGPHSQRVLCWGAQAAAHFGARLEVAHAAGGLEAAGIDEDAWRRTVGARLEDRIAELKRPLAMDAETLIEFGHPARVVSELARQRGAGLVVLGRGVSQDLLGRLRANAYDIIRRCACPVASI